MGSSIGSQPTLTAGYDYIAEPEEDVDQLKN
jgi:hypothetical protein